MARPAITRMVIIIFSNFNSAFHDRVLDRLPQIQKLIGFLKVLQVCNDGCLFYST